MLEIQNLTKTFGKKTALRSLSLALPEGTVALLGANGAGKTTLLRMVLELYRCKSGVIRWNEEDVTNRGVIPARSGYLPQKFGVFPNLTASEMLNYFAIIKQIPRSRIGSEIQRCLKIVNLEDRADSRCGSLSGGMVRRLGIAQALLGDPEFLFFDEPTAGLDPEERIRFKLMIHQQVSAKTVVISTHIVDDVEALCGHVIVMDHGQVIQNLPSRQLAAKARGLIWRVPKSIADQLPDDAYVRAMREEPGGEVLYVLSQSPIGEPVEPTVEDGYLCCLRRIGGTS